MYSSSLLGYLKATAIVMLDGIKIKIWNESSMINFNIVDYRFVYNTSAM